MTYMLMDLEDFRRWDLTKNYSEAKLLLGGWVARDQNRATTTMDKEQFKRWRAGELTPWLRPDAVLKHHGPCSWPVLP